jgi:probable addiction module antidote protein
MGDISKMNTKSYRDGLLSRLRDSDYAVGYLTEVLNEGDSEAFFIALRDVIDARDENITSLADRSGVSRQALYKALSEGGNPGFATIAKVLKSLNLQFSGLRTLDEEDEKEAA